jgi:hypothetical protein
MKLPTRFIVIGRPYGPCKSTSERAVTFEVSAIFEYNDSHNPIEQSVASIPLSPDTSLPSYNPFLKYELIAKRRDMGPLYDVQEVISVTRLHQPLTLKILREYFYKEGAKADKPHDFRGWVNHTTSKIPKTIKTLDDILDNVQEEKMRKWITELTKILFKPKSYYVLLKYFHEAFLNLFNDREIEIVRQLVIHKPYIFCFRSLMWRILNDIRVSTGNGGEGRLFVPDSKEPEVPRWAKLADLSRNYCFDKERLLSLSSELRDSTATQNNNNNNTTKTFYSSKHYTWSINTLSSALIYDSTERLIEENESHFNLDLYVRSLEYYLACEQKRLFFGRTTNPCPKDEDVRRFLIDNRIMRAWTNQNRNPDSQIEFTYPERDAKELALMSLLRNRVKNIDIIECHQYNQNYITRLTEVITKFHKQERRADCMCLITAGEDMAMELTDRTSYEFFGIWDLTQYTGEYCMQKAFREKDPIVLIDRAHKLSTDQLLSILEMMVVAGDTGDFVLKRLLLVGDTAEHQNGIPILGCGNPYLDLWHYATFVRKISWNRAADTVADTLCAGIMERDQSKLAIVTVDNISDLPEKIKKWTTTIKNTKKKANATVPEKKKNSIEKKNELRCHIFVSTQSDRDKVMKVLKKDDGKEYERYFFQVNDYVNVLDMGRLGQIRRITEMKKRRKDSAVINECHVNQVVCKMTIATPYRDIEILTDEHVVVHQNVDVISQYLGSRVEYAIFWVGENTKEIDLVSAAKYVQKEMQIFVLANYNFSNIYKGKTGTNDGFKRLAMQQYFTPTSALMEKIMAANKSISTIAVPVQDNDNHIDKKQKIDDNTN